MTVNRVKNNFSGGELDPQLLTRTDLDVWINGLRTGRNLKLLAQGGFTRRPGSRFVEELLPQITRLTAGITITQPNGGTGANANDGDELTGMVTSTQVGVVNPYVVVHYDLGSAKAIRFADVVGFSLSSGTVDASDWFVQYSTDNVTFTSLGEAVPIGNQTIGERTRRRTGPITARYWRLARIGATDYSTAVVNLREFNLWQDTVDLSAHRRVKHDFSASQKFLLLFTDRNARVYKKVNGVPVRQADIRTNFTSAQLSLLNWDQSLDTLIAVHADVRPHKIQRQSADTQWQTDQAFLDLSSVRINNETVNDFTVSPTDAFAGIQFTNGGAMQRKDDVAGAYADVSSEEWHFPRRTINAGEYEIRATLLAGTPPTVGTMDTWLDLGTTREWNDLETTNGNATTTSTIFFEIRDAVTQVVEDDCTVTLTAQVSL